jgi:uncharacterized cupredoxin-like copper-binding protein/Cu/Ag efflux protein CusF
MKLNPFKSVFFLSFILASTTALATGNHAGGHDSGEAIGKAGEASAVNRTINISMNDKMRFYPSSIRVKNGETIKFVISNEGKIKHEMVLGSSKELREHAALMQKFPEMVHADANMASVAPGGRGEMIWQFTKAGTVNFACLQPGHMQAGMVGKVRVAANAIPSAKKLGATNSDAANVVRVADNSAAATAAAVPAAVSPVASGKGEMTEGEVKKVDMDTKKITLKHGDIKNLDMPGMTMVFQVKDAAMLEKVKVGDKIKFKAEKMDGSIVVTEIETR